MFEFWLDSLIKFALGNALRSSEQSSTEFLRRSCRCFSYISVWFSVPSSVCPRYSLSLTQFQFTLYTLICTYVHTYIRVCKQNLLLMGSMQGVGSLVLRRTCFYCGFPKVFLAIFAQFFPLADKAIVFRLLIQRSLPDHQSLSIGFN